MSEKDEKAWYLANEESQALIKQLSAEEELLNFNSPQGLLVSVSKVITWKIFH